VFFGAWWWPVALGLVGILLYPKFYEVLLPALLLDLIYGASNLGWFGWQFAASAMALILVLVINQLKRYLNL
jgi:hypothetical protein